MQNMNRAFIDVRDLPQACICTLTCEMNRFACLLVAAADVHPSGPTSGALAEITYGRIAND